MSAGAVVMLAIGGLGLWGGVALAIWNYWRRSRADRHRAVSPPDAG